MNDKRVGTVITEVVYLPNACIFSHNKYCVLVCRLKITGYISLRMRSRSVDHWII